MILIADSGSTKCDWLLIDSSGKSYGSFSTIGFNPYFHDANDVETELTAHPTIASESYLIKRVFFYGAGCSSAELNHKIEQGLKKVFKNARVYVDHDLIGAAYSTYEGSPAITAILGTGSNSCFFDGENVYEEVPSLAYILGDESSGSYYGKRLLRDYFYKKLPLEMSEAFEREFHLDKDELVKRIYNEAHANVYLASFMKFIGKFGDHAHVKSWLREGMTKFLDIHVQCYPQYREVKTHFVGSVAYYFHHILKERCEAMDVNMGRIIQKPIDGLVEYHLNYKMAELQF